jgi:hypothetical protein
MAATERVQRKGEGWPAASAIVKNTHGRPIFRILPADQPRRRLRPKVLLILAAATHQLSRKSPQRCTVSFAPHGMIGTLEVEFFGDPSIKRSE